MIVVKIGSEDEGISVYSTGGLLLQYIPLVVFCYSIEMQG
jgi:hypothetical protein